MHVYYGLITGRVKVWKGADHLTNLAAISAVNKQLRAEVLKIMDGMPLVLDMRTLPDRKDRAVMPFRLWSENSPRIHRVVTAYRLWSEGPASSCWQRVRHLVVVIPEDLEVANPAAYQRMLDFTRTSNARSVELTDKPRTGRDGEASARTMLISIPETDSDDIKPATKAPKDVAAMETLSHTLNKRD